MLKKTDLTFFGFLLLGILIYSCSGGNRTPGERVFVSKCARCHGIDGKKKAKGAKDLNLSKKTLDFRINQIKTGKEKMPSFKNRLTEEQIRLVAEYTISKFGGPDTVSAHNDHQSID